ncbi:hypothetical protein MXB_4995 [Myxobolus squamalis]|nr:hypothetical protein MXB_4995 [Myxobolus squamalis]
MRHKLINSIFVWFGLLSMMFLILLIPLTSLMILPESAFFIRQKFRNEYKTKTILQKNN